MVIQIHVALDRVLYDVALVHHRTVMDQVNVVSLTDDHQYHCQLHRRLLVAYDLYQSSILVPVHLDIVTAVQVLTMNVAMVTLTVSHMHSVVSTCTHCMVTMMMQLTVAVSMVSNCVDDFDHCIVKGTYRLDVDGDASDGHWGDLLNCQSAVNCSCCGDGVGDVDENDDDTYSLMVMSRQEL